jgi:hypothetical protein
MRRRSNVSFCLFFITITLEYNTTVSTRTGDVDISRNRVKARKSFVLLNSPVVALLVYEHQKS